MNLSPLTHRGLFEHLRAHPEWMEPEPEKKVEPPEMITAWKCAECGSIYEDDYEAEECCAVDGKPSPKFCCPVCGDDASNYHEAVECCLWKDIPKDCRERILEDLESNGGNWLEALAKEGISV